MKQVFLFLLMMISITLSSQKLNQIQKGTARNQITVSNGVNPVNGAPNYTLVYRDALPYILDTLGVRDSFPACCLDSIFIDNDSLYYVIGTDTFNVGEIGGSITIYQTDTMPTDAKIGDLKYDVSSSFDIWSVWNGSTWITIYDGDNDPTNELTSYMFYYGFGMRPPGNKFGDILIDNQDDYVKYWDFGWYDLFPINQVTESTTVSDSPTLDLTLSGFDISGKVDTSIIATNYDVSLKQNILVSGTNIKTINGNSLLGSGNLSISTVDSTNVLNSYGTIINESPANTFNIKVDTSIISTIVNVKNLISDSLATIVFPIDSTTVLGGIGITAWESPANTWNIQNDDPDQTVTLSPTGIVNISGAYPNFTIGATELDGSTTNEKINSISWNDSQDSLQVIENGVIYRTKITGFLTETDTTLINQLISDSLSTYVFETDTSLINQLISDSLATINQDQIVSITGAGITNVTGTYPNFTITSTEVDGDPNNEKQTLSQSFTGTTQATASLSLSGGSYVDTTGYMRLETMFSTAGSRTYRYKSNLGAIMGITEDPTLSGNSNIEVLRTGNQLTWGLRKDNASNGQIYKYNGTAWALSSDVSGISTLNGLTAPTQTFATGTSGTDFNISSATSTHTFNFPNSSAANRGLLTSADWTTFNNKFTLPSLTSGSVLFSNGTTIAQDNANFFWNNSTKRLGIGLASPTMTLDVRGRANVSDALANVFIASGNTTLTGSYNMGLGYLSLLKTTTGSYNSGIGTYSLFENTTGSNNVGIGPQSLFSNTTGSNNVGLSENAGYYNATGSYNTGIGRQANFLNTSGSNSVGIGAFSLYSALGSGNVGIGYASGYSETGSNRLYIENSTSSTPLIGGHFDNRRVGINTSISDIGRTLDVNGEVRIRGAIYDSANSAGSSGQVLTSQGSGAWIWATPTETDGSITNEGYQGVTAGSGTSSVIQGYNSAGTATGTGTTINAGGSISISETVNTNGGQITLTGDYGAFTVAATTGGSGLVGPLDGDPFLTFTAGSGMTITRSGTTGDNQTLTFASTGGTTNLSYSTKSGTDVTLESSTGADVILRDGVGTIVNRVSANVIKYDVDEIYGQLSNTAIIASTTIDGVYRSVDFTVPDESFASIIDAKTASDEIEVLVAGTYEIHYSLSYLVPSNRDVRWRIYKNTADIGYIGELTTSFTAGHPSKTFNIALAANDKISLRFLGVNYVSGTIDINSPVLKVRRIK